MKNIYTIYVYVIIIIIIFIAFIYNNHKNIEQNFFVINQLQERMDKYDNMNIEQNNAIYEIQSYSYMKDIEKAKDILEKNGYGTGFDFEGINNGNIIMYCYSFMESVYKSCENNKNRRFEINTEKSTIILNK